MYNGTSSSRVMRRLATLFPSEYLGYSPPPLLERLIEDAQKIH
ncbi:IS4 transposase [Halapricum desulfuricans]|uniref:IS4 transposase n=1 Tax=Halapricum desulfuricans TaxID=2841257 RepID=A0A897N3V1_9EURY|nr:IS4 transposase [Halapricum desulfuricans]